MGVVLLVVGTFILAAGLTYWAAISAGIQAGVATLLGSFGASSIIVGIIAILIEDGIARDEERAATRREGSNL